MTEQEYQQETQRVLQLQAQQNPQFMQSLRSWQPTHKELQAAMSLKASPTSRQQTAASVLGIRNAFVCVKGSVQECGEQIGEQTIS